MEYLNNVGMSQCHKPPIKLDGWNPTHKHGDIGISNIYGISIELMTGWWLSHPSEKYESQLG